MEDTFRKIQRSHDLFYLTEDTIDNPKESFKFVTELIRKSLGTIRAEISIADWGCATGAFPHYLNSQFPDARIIGFEFLESLLDEARNRFPDLQFRHGSLLNPNSNSELFDITTVMGVISIFDNVEPALENLVNWSKKGGKILIHGMFNKADVDVYIKYALSTNYESNILESGWNIISRSTITRLLNKLNVASIVFHDLAIGIDLPKHPTDPLRSWTQKSINGERFITNGLSLIQPQAILEITV